MSLRAIEKLCPLGFVLKISSRWDQNCSRGLSYEFLSPEISNKFNFTCDSIMFPSSLPHWLTRKSSILFTSTPHAIKSVWQFHITPRRTKKISPLNNRKSIIYSIDFHFCLIKALFVPLIWSWVDSIHKLWCYCQQVHIDYLLHGARRGLLN